MLTPTNRTLPSSAVAVAPSSGISFLHGTQPVYQKLMTSGSPIERGWCRRRCRRCRATSRRAAASPSTGALVPSVGSWTVPGLSASRRRLSSASSRLTAPSHRPRRPRPRPRSSPRTAGGSRPPFCRAARRATVARTPHHRRRSVRGGTNGAAPVVVVDQPEGRLSVAPDRRLTV